MRFGVAAVIEVIVVISDYLFLIKIYFLKTSDSTSSQAEQIDS